MIFEHKLDRESYTRSKDLETLKSNIYLKENEIVKLSNNINYYKITSEVTDIQLENGLYAKQIFIKDNNLNTEDKTIIGSINEIYNKIGDDDFNSGTSSKLETPRKIQLSGDVSGEEYFDGSKDIDIHIEILNDSHNHDNRYNTKTEIDSKINDTKIEIDNEIEKKFSSGTYPNITVGKANSLNTPVNITLVGDINGRASFDGSSDVEINTEIGDLLELTTEKITSLKGYQIKEEGSSLDPTDTLNDALGKLEKRINDAPKESIYNGTEEPTDKNVIWINPLEENYDYIPPGEDNLYTGIKKQLDTFKNQIDEMYYSFNYKIDGGERIKEEVETNLKTSEEEGGLEGEYPELDEDYRPNTKEDIQGIVKHICVARGSRENMGNLLSGEFFLDTDNNEIYMGTNNGPILVGSNNNSGGGGNLTGEYLQLTDPKGVPYKIKVNQQGQLEIYKASIDNLPLPNPNEPEEGGIFHENWDEYKSSDKTGLCINQIYSGGPLNSDNTPVSHSFIEIYNNSERDISLRGLSIQYAKFGKDWKVCPLDGILPGNTSYLIRCVKNTNPYKLSCRVKINNFDLDWNQELSDTGMKVALVVGTEPLDTENPYRDPLNNIPSIYRYIDMLGAGGKELSQKIDYQEGYFSRHCLDRNTSVCRTFRTGLKDNGDNLLDTIAIDYRYADIEMYGPRCKADGPWDIYRDKLKLNENRPNMIFITFGKNQNTRIFTWQTKPTKEGILKIRKKGEYDWKSYKSTLRNISHHDTPAVTHTVKITDLEPGIYEYKCGEEGMWSDEYKFEVFDNLYGDFTTPETDESKFSDRTIKILHTSDQQGWSEEEYLAWKYAHDYIYKTEKTDLISPNYHWRFNTGDASQNGNRSYEWRYYYEYAKEDLSNTVEMLVIGNNDLIDKKKSEAYTYYSNYEESPYPGCYEFFIGDCHFLAFNTWAEVDTDYVDNDGITIGYTQKQIEWLKEKLRGERKRWTIVLTHVAPYTIVRQKQGQPYRVALEGNNGEYQPVDLVICGHNHAYSRSQPMLNEEINKLNGVYHIMCQATGYKLSGKEKPNPEGEPWYGLKPDGSYAVGVPGNPSYILWEITKDYIEFKAYMIQGIIQKDSTTKEVTYGNPSEYKKELIDTFKIYHRSVREEHIEEL